MICTPPSAEPATMPYVRPSASYTSTSDAPARALNPPIPSNAADTGAGFAGSVTSMICTPLSIRAATIPYVRPCMLNTSTPFAPFRAPNPPVPSNAADTGAGCAGSVTSIICTPPSWKSATMPYILPCMLNTSTSAAPFRAPKPPEPSNTADTGAGCAGSVTSMICTPPSAMAATTPYVRPFMLNTSTPAAMFKAPKPPEPSNTADTGAGCAGSVTSMICTPPSAKPATMPYIRPSIPNTSTSVAPARALNPSELSNTVDTGAGRAMSVMSMICTTP